MNEPVPAWDEQCWQQPALEQAAEIRETQESVKMGWNMKASNTGGDFELAPEGTHSAVCVRLVDIGTQPTQFGDKRKVQIGFEIDEKRNDGKPFMAFAHFTLSMHAKAALRQFLESWRSRAFADEECFNLADIVGKPGLLTLVRDGDYTNIKSIGPLMKGMTALSPAGDTIVFSAEDPDLGELDKLSERMQDKIQASPEYRQAMNKPAAPVAEMEAVGAGADDLDDDIPF